MVIGAGVLVVPFEFVLQYYHQSQLWFVTVGSLYIWGLLLILVGLMLRTDVDQMGEVAGDERNRRVAHAGATVG